MIAVRMLAWLFVEHHNGLPAREFDLFFLHLSTAVFISSFLWLLYVALEPFVRRRWPGWIISWSRLLTGDYRDPLVGRDILLGAVIGAGTILVQILSFVAPRWIGRPSSFVINPGTSDIAHLFFLRFAAQLYVALFFSFIALLLLLLFVAVLRRERFAVVGLWLLMTLLVTLVARANMMMVPFLALGAFLVVFALKRYGLLTLISTLFFYALGVFYPMTTELTAWYATDFTIGLVICIALAAFGFYTSLGGQKLLSGKLLEE